MELPNFQQLRNQNQRVQVDAFLNYDDFTEYLAGGQ